MEGGGIEEELGIDDGEEGVEDEEGVTRAVVALEFEVVGEVGEEGGAREEEAEGTGEVDVEVFHRV